MKTIRRSLCLLTFIGATAIAQVAATGSPTPSEAAAPTGALRSAEQLEQLLAPIALYPDALIALILPASTASTDIVLAARHLRDFPDDRSQVEHRAWDESVKSLINYPEVLKWMDENLPWTQQVGEAFLLQPADVMQAIQRLRARARAAGTLIDTPQQQVLAEPDVIRIVPAQPDIIYVPRYEPDVVFYSSSLYYTRPLLTFGLGARVGSWLAYDCDWRRKTIWIGDRHRHWRGHDWRRPVVPIAPGFTHHVSPGVRQWCPPTRVSRPSHYTSTRRRTEIIRPTHFGTPSHHSYGTRTFSPHPQRSGPPPQHRVSGTQHRSTGPHHPITAPAHAPTASPLSTTTTARTFSPSTRGTVTSHSVAPSSTRLYVTDPGRTRHSVTPPLTPSAITRTPTHAQRGRDSRTSISLSRPPAPLQPAMGPHPISARPAAPAATTPRYEPRAHRAAPGHSFRPPAPPAPQPIVAPAPAAPRAPVAHVQSAQATNGRPASPAQNQGGSRRSFGRGHSQER